MKPASLKQGEAAERLREIRPDLLVVAAYGLILPAAVLAIPARGCLNIHASLLPRWRGAAPIQRALLAGDTVTGISIMQMDAGLDTGPVLLREEIAIGPRETAGSLTAALAELGARSIVAALRALDSLAPQAQNDSTATYAAKIDKAEARIDWRLPSLAIDRAVRAFDPHPGAQTGFGGEVLKILEAEPAAGRGKPGEVIESQDGRLLIACGDGALRVARVQRPGGKPMAVEAYLRGAPIARGSMLESAAQGA